MDYDSLVLDDSENHFDKLLFLWIKSFTARFPSMIIFKTDEIDRSITDLYQVISLIDNLKLVIFSGDYSGLTSDINTTTICHDFESREFLPENIERYLKSKNEYSSMLLYYILITRGNILSRDIIHILQDLGYDPLILNEELEMYRMDGYLIGNSYLYSSSSHTVQIIEDINCDKTALWRELFVKSFLKLKFDSVFNYSLIFSTIGFTTRYKNQSIEVFYNFVQKLLDIGRIVEFSDELYRIGENIDSFNSILEYKKVREGRLGFNISDVRADFLETGNDYNSSLTFMDILNDWSSKNDRDLVNRSKELYYYYQMKGKPYKESRAKIVFALALLSTGRESEAVDYFELNCASSKNINDKYSYIRNICFLAVSLFAKGDISGVLRVTEIALEYKWIYFKNRWLLYAKFLRARALNEVGDYSSALVILEEGVILSKKFILKIFLLSSELAGKNLVLS